MPGKPIQEYLFQRIKEQLNPGQSLADAIAETLFISPDSAYRRIRGETLLVLDEAKTLCEKYHISLDSLFQQTAHSVTFHNIELNEEGDFAGYLKGILKQIKQLDASVEKNIIYITNDIPLFHQFYSKPVLAFRYFFWMKTMFQQREFMQKKFSVEWLTPEIESIAKEIVSVYARIPSVEIWNAECVNSMLLQLNYYGEAGLVTREDARTIYAGLRLSLEHLQRQAELGRKFLPGENPQSKKENFQLFYNRVGIGNNTILTSHDGGKTLYLNYDALNYIITTDAVFCDKVDQQLQTIMRRSTLISHVSEKQRNMFFNILYSRFPQGEFNKEKLAL
jgi:hypothetical protein